MNEDLKIDANSRWVLGAVTNDSNMYIRNARVNPISGALIVEANVTSSNTSIGSTIPGATQGSVFFAGLGGTLAQDNANFFWDDTNNYLGLGTDTPAETLHVVGTAIITGDVGTANQLLGRDSGTGEISGITVGSGLSLSGNTLTATGSGGSGYDTIENEGVAVTQRSTINLTNLLAASDVGGKTQLTIDVANLATDTTFIDDLIANSYFTTSLANDSTFISTLTGNSTFISDVVNIVNSSGSIAIDLSSQVTGVLGTTNGGTGISSVSQGDLLYGSATDTWSTLAKNTSATRYLSNTGTNNNPAWAQVDLSNGVTNTLAVGNGGTGATSHTAYAVICGGTSSGGALQSIASVGTTGQVLTSNGAGALPTFQTFTGGAIPQQEIPLDSDLNGGQTFKITSTPDGDLAIITTLDNSGSMGIYRLERNTANIQYEITHTATLTSPNPGVGQISAGAPVILGAYAYIFFSIAGTTAYCYRYDIADLTNPTNMTISGTTWTGFAGAVFTDGTYLYGISSASNFNQYSVSGTTITYVNTITYTSAGDVRTGGAISDGTSVWMSAVNGSVKKYPVAGGAASATGTYIYYSGAYNNATSNFLYLYNSSVLGVGVGFDGTNAAIAKLITTTLPN